MTSKPFPFSSTQLPPQLVVEHQFSHPLRARFRASWPVNLHQFTNLIAQGESVAIAMVRW